MSPVIAILTFLIPVCLSALINLSTSDSDVQKWYLAHHDASNYVLVGLLVLGIILAISSQSRSDDEKYDSGLHGTPFTSALNGLAVYSILGAIVWVLSAWQYENLSSFRFSGLLSHINPSLDWLTTMGFDSFTAGMSGGLAGAHLGSAARFKGSGILRLFGFVVGALIGMSLYPILNSFIQTSVSPGLGAVAHTSVPDGMLACATIGGLVGSFVSIFEYRYQMPKGMRDKLEADRQYKARYERAMFILKSKGVRAFEGSLSADVGFELVREGKAPVARGIDYFGKLAPMILVAPNGQPLERIETVEGLEVFAELWNVGKWPDFEELNKPIAGSVGQTSGLPGETP